MKKKTGIARTNKSFTHKSDSKTTVSRRLLHADKENLLHSLNERVKEQSCLYNIANLSNLSLGIDDLLKQATELIPPGWQYPDITTVAIRYGKKQYKTLGHKKTHWTQIASGKTKDGNTLTIEVSYHKKRANEDEGPFLTEERKLLENIISNLILQINQFQILQKLKQSEQYLTTILNSEPECVKVVSRDGKVVSMNPAGLKIIEAERQSKKVIGGDVLKLIYPTDKKQYFTIHRKALRGNQAEGRFRIIGLRGTLRWMETTSVPLRDDKGKVNAVLSVTRDISDKVLSEEKIARATLNNELLLQSTGEGIYGIDANGRCTFINKSGAQMLGYTPDECIGKSMHDLIHYKKPDGRKYRVSECPITHAKSTGKGCTIEDEVYWHKKGHPIAVRYTSTPIIVNKKNAGAVIVFNDITESKKIREEIEKSEKRFKSLVQEGSDLTGILTKNGDYLYVSPNYPNIVGYTDKELVGKSAFHFVHPQDLPFILKEFKLLKTNKRVKSSPYRFKKKDGSWCWIQTVATNLIHDETIEGIVINSIDITDLIAVQNILKKSTERYEYVNKATNDAIYDWDAIRDEFQWGEGYSRLFGARNKNKPFKLIDWANQMHPDDNEKNKKPWDDFIADPKQTKWHKEFRFKKSDGSYLYVEEIGHLIRDEHGKPYRMIGVLRDISEHKQVAEQNEIQQQVSSFFKDENTLNQSIQQTLKYLTTLGSFKTAEVWLASSTKDTINLLSTFAFDSVSERYFKESNEVRRLKSGVGLPGKVWQSLKTEIWNIEENKEFVRRSAALKANLKSVFAMPLYHNSVPIGVLAFCSDQNTSLHHEYISKFISLGNYIGAEIKRKQQEEEMYLLFESAPEILAIASPNGHFVKVNPAFCKIMGYTEKELTSHPFEHFIHPDDLSKTITEYNETITGDRNANNFVNRYRTKSGKYRWISWNSSNAFGEDGHVFSYGRDVTNMKELQNLLDTATQLSRLGGWEYDVINNKLIFSPITKQIHEIPEGYEPDIDRAIEFYKAGESRNTIRQKVNEAIQHGTPYDVELILITANGNERWVRAIGNAEIIDGKCIRLYGSFQDIHERKSIELRLKNISDNVPGTLFQYHLAPDGTDKLLYVSKGSEKLWGLAPEACMEDITKVWKQIIDGGDVDQMKQSIMESAKNLTPWHYRWRNILPNGSIRYHEGFGNPQKLTDGTIVWDSIVMDVTDKHDLEELARRTSKMARIGSWELDLINNDSHKMYWSSMTRKILEVDDHYNPTFTGGLEFYETESRKRIEEAVTKLIATGEEFDLELLIMTATGTSKWVRCIGQSDRVKHICTRIYGSFQDIHKQKIVELELQHAFEEKNTILESIGDAFFAVDKAWIVTYWNKEAEKVLGKKKSELIGMNLWDVFPDAKGLDSYKNYHRALATGEIVDFEDYYPTTNQWFEVSAYPSSKGLSVYFKDVTLRKTVEERVRQSNERFEKIAEATNDAIWDYDVIHNSLFWGKGFCTLFGYNPEEIKPSFELLTSLIHPDDRNRIIQKIQEYMQDESATNWFEEYRFQKSDKTYALVIDRAKFIRNNQKNVIRVVGAMTDISYRKEHEESLQRLNAQLEKHTKDLEASNAELEQFAYVASHDLQEPLRMVTSFLTQLEKVYSKTLDDRAKQYIHFAVDGSKRMRQIILDLLDFSRVGKHEDKLEIIDTANLVEEVCVLHKQLIEEKQAIIHYGNLPKINTYRTPLTQIFRNLIHNALKYTHTNRKPEIYISAKENNNFIEFSIRDNGIGISKEYHEKIFIIFQRLHPREKYSGTGIGLSIVKKIVDNLGGTISVESEPEKGSTFRFSIPINANKTRAM